MANAPAVLGDPEDRRGVRHHGNRRAFRQRPWAFQNDHAANDFACEDHVEIIHRNLIVFKVALAGDAAHLGEEKGGKGVGLGFRGTGRGLACQGKPNPTPFIFPGSSSQHLAILGKPQPPSPSGCRGVLSPGIWPLCNSRLSQGPTGVALALLRHRGQRAWRPAPVVIEDSQPTHSSALAWVKLAGARQILSQPPRRLVRAGTGRGRRALEPPEPGRAWNLSRIPWPCRDPGADHQAPRHKA